MNCEEQGIKERLLQKKEIVFVNEPFMAVVEGKGEEPIKCYPVVYDEFYTCGVGVIYETGSRSIWGLMGPRDLIAAWRATEILQHVASIKNETLCYAYYAGQRNTHSSDQYRVDEIIAIIGKKKHDKIMAMPIPEKIIQAIIDRQKAEMPPSTYPITNELRVGTVLWRPEFADIKVKRPEEINRRSEMFENTVARYEKLLGSYAEYISLPRKCNGMHNVESALVTLVEKKIDQDYSADVVTALAGVAGQLSCLEETIHFCQPSSQEEYDRWFASKKDLAIREAATWIVKGRSKPWIFFWRKKYPLTEEATEELLESLFAKFFPPPQKSVSKKG